jgi:hypothetical protein
MAAETPAPRVHVHRDQLDSGCQSSVRELRASHLLVLAYQLQGYTSKEAKQREQRRGLLSSWVALSTSSAHNHSLHLLAAG